MEKDAALLGGDLLGAVATGGDLTVGTVHVTAGERAARLDGTPVGVLVGGKIVRAEPDSTLTVGNTGQLLVGELAGSLPVQQADGLALLAEGAATDAAPLVTVATQSADSVLAAGLFQQTFAGVFDDLRARSTALAALPSTLQATDSAGSPLASFDGTQVHLTPTDGVNVWTVSADGSGWGAGYLDRPRTDRRRPFDHQHHR